jgi:DNA-binding response OmpR family regulator
VKQSILLIDDSESIHRLVISLLREESVSLNSAYDGEAGIALAGRFRPDLILLDVDMPGTNGFDVCRRLNEDASTSNIPIVFLTSAGEVGQKVHGLDLGAIDYITKPFDPTEFAARVRTALRTKLRQDSIRSSRVDEFIARALHTTGSV